MSYLVLYTDGANGLRRGGVCEALPQHAVQTERNPGEKIFESAEGDTWYVELLGRREPVYSEDRAEDVVTPVTVTACDVENSDDRSYGTAVVRWATPRGELCLAAGVHTSHLEDQVWTLDGIDLKGGLELSPPDVELPALAEAESLSLQDHQFVEYLRKTVAEWVYELPTDG